MSGNVEEWCWDSGYDGSRVSCGGCWDGRAGYSEVDHENYNGPKYQYSNIGIRIVCSLE